MGYHQQAAGSHTPREALDRLRDLAGSGELAAFCTQHDIRLLVAFGSAVTGGGQAPARDLDLAVLPDRCSGGSGWVELVSELIHLVRFDDVDALNPARARDTRGTWKWWLGPSRRRSRATTATSPPWPASSAIGAGVGSRPQGLAPWPRTGS